MEDNDKILSDVPIKLKKNLEVIENTFDRRDIPDGQTFIRNLRKEARRQKAAKACEHFESVARAIEDLPYIPTEAEERRLSEDFEIIEEE